MGKIIVNHATPEYEVTRSLERGGGRYNGAYYYSREITKYFVPVIETDRGWVIVNQKGFCEDGAIVFIHNNLHPEYYDWLSEYKDLILVCGLPSTAENMKHLGKTIYLPLSVDVDEVAWYRTKKTKGTAFVGRSVKREGTRIPHGIRFIEDLERSFLLQEVAKYRRIYAVGRTAIEGKILGCEILPYDKRFPDPSIWKIIDSSEACQMLQAEIDIIDKR